MGKTKRRSRSANPRPPQKQLKRTHNTRSQARAHTVQSRVIKTPSRSVSKKTLGARRRQSKRRAAQWTYIGSHTDEKNEVQTAKPVDIVEADVQIIDKKNSACGTRFIFERYEHGFIVGHLDGPNGRVDLRKTAGHVSVCHASALEPNSGNLGSRTRQRTETLKLKEYKQQNQRKSVAKGRAMARAIVDAHKKKTQRANGKPSWRSTRRSYVRWLRSAKLQKEQQGQT